MPQRHPILYDLQRWRRNRLWLLLPAAVLGGLVVLFDLRADPASASTSALVAGLLLALAVVYWLRQRFSYLRVDGQELLVRSLPWSARVPLERVRRVRTAPMRSVYDRPGRRRLLPRQSIWRPTQWLEVPAIMVRLADSADRARLVRVVGRRALIDEELVAPVEEADRLAREIHAARPQLVGAPARARGRRR